MTTPFKLRGWSGYQSSPMQDTDPHTGINPIHGPEDHGNPKPGTGTKTKKKTKEKTTTTTTTKEKLEAQLVKLKAQLDAVEYGSTQHMKIQNALMKVTAKLSKYYK